MDLGRRNILRAGTAALPTAGLTKSFSIGEASAQQAVDVPDDVRELLTAELPGISIDVTGLRMIEFGNVTYYIAQVSETIDDDRSTAEPVVVKRAVGSEPVVLEDFAGLPQVPVNELTYDARDVVDISLFALDERDLDVDRLPAPFNEALSAALDAKVRASAEKWNNKLSSADIAGTNHGRLACAWAVNKVLKLFGRSSAAADWLPPDRTRF